jgi:hypothetical protein
MNVLITIPDDISRKLEAQWQDVAQRAKEALAIDAYRAGVLTEAEVQRMLNLASRWQVDELLKRARAYLDYTEADLQQDINSIRQLTAT